MAHGGQKVSVLIHTLNEEKNIRNALESVKWADEIIVTDMHSDDRTVAIAKEYTEKIFFHNPIGYVEPARQFAFEQAAGDWILYLDADEMIPRPLKEKLFEFMARPLADILWLPRKNYFFGDLLKVTGKSPLGNIHPRFFRKGFSLYSSVIHGFAQAIPRAKVFYLRDPAFSIIHFNYLDFEHYLDKFNKYTTIEAQNMYQGIKIPQPSAWAAFWHAGCEFVFNYIKAGGYKAGFRGLVLSTLEAVYVLVVHLKWLLMRQYQSLDIKESVRSRYLSIASNILKEYEN